MTKTTSVEGEMWKINGDFKFEVDFKNGLREIHSQKSNFKVSGILIYKHKDDNFRNSVSKESTWINLHNESGEDFIVFCFKDSTIIENKKDERVVSFMTAMSSSRGPRETYDKLFHEMFGRKIIWDHSPILLLESKNDNGLTIFRLPQILSTSEYDSYLPKLLRKISDYIDENPESTSQEIGKHISENHTFFQIYASALAYLPSRTKIAEFIQKIIDKY